VLGGLDERKRDIMVDARDLESGAVEKAI